ncbi:MAG: alpha/beta hydrolase, partial [Actinomycetota bacterium]|nr:alpha/beta hydrolase [Actinomycetota bacterium]
QAAVDAIPAESLLPFDRATALADSAAQLCLDWPQAPDPPALVTSPPPPAPTLLFSGTRDTRTPLSDAQAISAGLPDARLVRVTGVGHSVLGGSLSDCPLLQLDRFFAGRTVAARCDGLATNDAFLSSIAGLFSPRVYPVPPASLRQLVPAHGLPGKRGRTATAALLTFIDAFPTVLSTVLVQDPAVISGAGANVGGLRGGYYTLRGDRLTLHRVVYVPGVVVSGTIRFVGTAGLDARLRISGAAAAHGTVTINERLAMRGRLGGRRIDVPPPTRLARAGAAPDLGARLATAPALRHPDRLAQLAARRPR